MYDDRLMCIYLSFFFFKQKTAYDMRISDWSSDVCSSDLSCGAVAQMGERRVRNAKVRGSIPLSSTIPPHPVRIVPILPQAAGCVRRLAVGSSRGRRCANPCCSSSLKPPDRKSVVSGTSVSVRVDLGGRRIIKKHKHKEP